MSTDDKFENTKDKLGGSAKEGLGKVTGDKETEAEGKTQKVKADVKDTVDDVKATVKGAVNNLTDRDDKPSSDR